MNTLGIFVFVVFSPVSVIGETELFISATGNDANPCTEAQPCKSVSHVCAVAPNGTTININGGGSPYLITDTIALRKSIKIQSWTSDMAVLNCTGLNLCDFSITSNISEGINMLEFSSLRLLGCGVCVNDSSLKILMSVTESGFTNMNLHESGGPYSLTVQSSEFKNNRMTFKSGTSNSSTTRVHFDTSKFYGNASSMQFSQEENSVHNISISMTSVVLHNMFKAITFSNFTQLQFEADNVELHTFVSTLYCMGVVNSMGTVTVTNSAFHDNLCVGGGAFYMQANLAGTTLMMENCSFSYNNAGLTGSGLKVMYSSSVQITKSKFSDNINTESGAALIIMFSHGTIEDCTFENNTVRTPGNHLIFGGDSWEKKGAGGAVYISTESNMTLDNCYFNNNTADWFGGSLASTGVVTLRNCLFRQAQHPQNNPLGIMMYMTGPTKMENVTCNTTEAYTSAPMIFFSSMAKSELSWIDKGILDFYCPVGAQFVSEALKASIDTVAPFKDLFVACEPCPMGTYSLQHGFHIGSIFDPHASWSSNFDCLQCPYGGTCDNGQVVAYENYWGYPVQKGNITEISFSTCPSGYCCSENECESYNSCHKGRQGTLCGQCTDGFSELMFTTDCYPNSKCHDYWYLAIDLLNAALYVLAFLYQIEIGTFIATKIFGRSAQKAGSPSAVTAYIKSIFYFYQAVTMLAVAENRASETIGLALQPVVASIISFSPVAALIATCPFPNMTPVTKVILRTLPTLYIYSGLAILAAAMVILERRKAKKLQEARAREYVATVENTVDLGESSHTSESTTDPNTESNAANTANAANAARLTQTAVRHNLRSRLSRACTNIFLLNYFTISALTLKLLACTNIGDKDVLYIDGTIQCVAGWQSVFIIIAIVHTVPFFMAVIVSRYLLDANKITVSEFFLSYVAPLPVLVYWVAVFGKEYWQQRKSKHPQRPTSVSLVSTPSIEEPDIVFVRAPKDNSIKQEILFIVEDPYVKVGLARSRSVLYWEGVFMFRRMVLIMMLVFITNPLLKMTMQTIACLVFLVWHMMAQPFRSKAANMLETVCLSVLTLVGITHMVQATYMSAGRSPGGPEDLQITITDWIEWVLVSLPPILIFTIMILLLLLRLLRLLLRAILGCIQKCRNLAESKESAPDREHYSDIE